MYAGHAYASAPYAGGGTTPVAPVAPPHADEDGRWREGRALLEVLLPVSPLPSGLVRGQRVDKALAYPAPVLVEGRPT